MWGCLRGSGRRTAYGGKAGGLLGQVLSNHNQTATGCRRLRHTAFQYCLFRVLMASMAHFGCDNMYDAIAASSRARKQLLRASGPKARIERATQGRWQGCPGRGMRNRESQFKQGALVSKAKLTAATCVRRRSLVSSRQGFSVS